jgi:predicted glycosyltransferase
MNETGNIKKPRVLVVPLNWGLGHATRMIPIITELKKMNADVIAGGSPVHLKLLRQEIAGLQTIPLPCLRIRLSGRKSQILSLVWQIPVFLLQIFK